jgi:hypothetical protein
MTSPPVHQSISPSAYHGGIPITNLFLMPDECAEPLIGAPIHTSHLFSAHPPASAPRSGTLLLFLLIPFSRSSMTPQKLHVPTPPRCDVCDIFGRPRVSDEWRLPSSSVTGWLSAWISLDCPHVMQPKPHPEGTPSDEPFALTRRACTLPPAASQTILFCRDSHSLAMTLEG